MWTVTAKFFGMRSGNWWDEAVANAGLRSAVNQRHLRLMFWRETRDRWRIPRVVLSYIL